MGSNAISSELQQNKYAPDNLEIVFFLISLQFIGSFFYAGYRIIFPFILLKLGYTSNQIATDWAIVFTIALFVGGFLTRVPMGVLSDVLSRKQGLFFGIIISLISVFLMIFTKNLIVLGLLFAILRTGTHIYPLTSRGYINETIPTKQRRLNGFVIIGADVASFFGPIILGIFLEFSIQSLIFFSCVIFILVTVVLYFTTPKKLQRKKLPAKRIFFQAIIELKQIWKMVVIYFIIGLINGIYGEILVPFMENTLHLSNLVTDFYVGIIQLTTILFILIQGQLNRRFNLFFLIVTGIIFTIFGSILIYFGKLNILSFIIGSILINGGVQIDIISITTSVTLTASKETAATCFGIVSSCFFLGVSLIPLFASYLYNMNPFYPYLLIILIGLIVILPVIKIGFEYKNKKGFTV